MRHLAVIICLLLISLAARAQDAAPLLAWVLAGEAASINPPPVSGYQVWFDASDAASITESSGVVTQWSDKSGHGYHLIQPTTGLAPTRISTNGYTAIQFDGVDNYMTNAIMPMATTSTWFIAICPGTTTLRWYFGNYIYPYHSVYGNVWLYAYNGDDSIYLANYQGTFAYMPYRGDWMGVARGVVSCRYKSESPHTITVRKNGYPVNGATKGSAASGIVSQTCRMANGSWHELLIFNRPLSDEEVLSVEAYLKAKWGTP